MPFWNLFSVLAIGNRNLKLHTIPGLNLAKKPHFLQFSNFSRVSACRLGHMNAKIEHSPLFWRHEKFKNS